MRVHHTRPLLGVVEGAIDALAVRARCAQPISPQIEARLAELPKEIASKFNFFASSLETIDFTSEPIIYERDEFAFFVDVESLSRAARELLIEMTPHYVSTWQYRGGKIADLWIGDGDRELEADERAALVREVSRIRALPVKGRTFTLDQLSFPSNARWLGTRDAIREAGANLLEYPSPDCDYYVTDREEASKSAREAGVKQVIGTLTLAILFSS